jgi:fido (protein-threonine AMPylation protein)
VDRDDLTGKEPFRALDDADQEAVDHLLNSARTAAAQTFGPFNDDEDSPFYAAEDASPEQTWERIAERVTLATTAAVVHGAAHRPISAADVSRLHEIVFATSFPEDAGRLRRRGEEAQYGIVIGTREQPVLSHARATAGVRVSARLDKTCREFNDAVEALESRETVLLDELALAVVRLYAKVLSIHPFVDGNGRTVFTLLQYALVRCGLACVALDDYAEHQWALGAALRIDGRQSYSPLQALLVAKLQRAQPPEDD